MRSAHSLLLVVTLLVVACATLRFTPELPRTWDPAAMSGIELPLFDTSNSPVHVSAEYYYKLPVRPVYKSYPLYHPNREPAGYLDRLRELEPEVVFDSNQLHTEQQWIDAGELVYHAPIEFDGPIVSTAMVLDAAWFERHKVPLRKDGSAPFLRWVVREKGKLELGNLSCAMCHDRVMPDGSVIKGAQGNFPFDEIVGEDFKNVPEAVVQYVTYALTAAPWAEKRGAVDARRKSRDEIAAAFSAVPPGTLFRQGTGLLAPVRVPDLIGIADRKYLDATGLVRHRSIGDLMRYAALNQGLDMLARFGDLIPGERSSEQPAPGKGTFAGSDGRYSDPQLYALARYLYSLRPPANPNVMDDLAIRGQSIFAREKCDACHTPPHYTNNKLIPVAGFTPPEQHRATYDISRRRVGTDPTLAMTTRRGTGYYKVPSLKGVWYRGSFEHSGSIATLEDWFDPRRLRDDYIPTGYKGRASRSIPGHKFGLDLSPEDKRSLLAFLRTL